LSVQLQLTYQVVLWAPRRKKLILPLWGPEVGTGTLILHLSTSARCAARGRPSTGSSAAVWWYECCGCACEPAEDEEDEKLLQSRRGKVQAGKEKLPKVKLVGSDLFLWQPCSFPAGLMLCMAKRTGNHLQYYFAPVDELMNPKVRVVRATVYNFRQHGRNARSLSVRDELLTRKQLC
jgi:hypothetical protein